MRAPFGVGDVIEQHRHFMHAGWVDGEKPDRRCARWLVTAIDDDGISVRLVAGTYELAEDEPDERPGYETRFEASDVYRRANPSCRGVDQALDEYRIARDA